jgi:isopropylmalate/homocitrate/citramalate synthase
MDFGLGVANTLMAAATGAEILQVTVSGIGERAGNTPLEETVMALRTLYDRDLGIRTERLAPLARLVSERTGVVQPSNRPITGERLFDVESGIIAGWVRNVRDVDITEAFPFTPEFVGQPGVRLVLGKGSGIDSVLDALDSNGLSATEAQAAQILQEVKQLSLSTKGLVSDEEFRRIADSVISG